MKTKRKALESSSLRLIKKAVGCFVSNTMLSYNLYTKTGKISNFWDFSLVLNIVDQIAIFFVTMTTTVP